MCIYMHNINEELWSFNASKRYKSNTFILNSDFFSSIYIYTLVILFRQTEIVLKDSTAFVYVTKSEKSTHFTLMT